MELRLKALQEVTPRHQELHKQCRPFRLELQEHLQVPKLLERKLGPKHLDQLLLELKQEKGQEGPAEHPVPRVLRPVRALDELHDVALPQHWKRHGRLTVKVIN